MRKNSPRIHNGKTGKLFDKILQDQEYLIINKYFLHLNFEIQDLLHCGPRYCISSVASFAFSHGNKQRRQQRKCA